MQLAKRFVTVHAFEPLAAHRECFRVNLKDRAAGVVLHGCALGEKAGVCAIETAPTSSGDSRVSLTPTAPAIPLRTLDSFDLRDVDFIKIDCEGYEWFVLAGGLDTVRRNRPVIIVEQKPGRAQRFGLREHEAVELLEGVGYRPAAVMAGDFVMVAA